MKRTPPSAKKPRAERVTRRTQADIEQDGRIMRSLDRIADSSEQLQEQVSRVADALNAFATVISALADANQPPKQESKPKVEPVVTVHSGPQATRVDPKVTPLRKLPKRYASVRKLCKQTAGIIGKKTVNEEVLIFAGTKKIGDMPASEVEAFEMSIARLVAHQEENA